MSLCLISAFLDIGRGDWIAFRRPVSQYIRNFMPYVKLDQEMIVFIDERHIEELRIAIGNQSKIKLFPINMKWLQENIYAFSKLPREKEIMDSEFFKILTRHRAFHPECCKPEYNIIQHAKIDFVVYAIKNQLSEAKYFAWSDFGFFQDPRTIPKATLDINKFDLEKVNIIGVNTLNNNDFDIFYTLLNAPERIGGFFFLGNSVNLLEYQKLYHQICTDFHTLGIVDDDQHIIIQSLLRNPSLFKLWNMGGWFLVYNHFQLL